MDGGRARLPIPRRDGDRLIVSKWQQDAFRVLDELNGGMSEFDSYLARGGITVE